jgi:hypothetical protein
MGVVGVNPPKFGIKLLKNLREVFIKKEYVTLKKCI